LCFFCSFFAFVFLFFHFKILANYVFSACSSLLRTQLTPLASLWNIFDHHPSKVYQISGLAKPFRCSIRPKNEFCENLVPFTAKRSKNNRELEIVLKLELFSWNKDSSKIKAIKMRLFDVKKTSKITAFSMVALKE